MKILLALMLASTPVTALVTAKEANKETYNYIQEYRRWARIELWGYVQKKINVAITNGDFDIIIDIGNEASGSITLSDLRDLEHRLVKLGYGVSEVKKR